MPLPSPRDDEKQAAFISRCMGDDEAKKTFPDEDQRLAVCYRQFDKRNEKAVGPDLTIEASVTFDIEGE